MKKAASIDEYILNNPKWEEPLMELHELIVSTGLEATIKWGGPAYLHDGKNVVGLGAFKNHFAIWFFNGVYLSDKRNILVNAQEGTTKALRQMRFNHANEINPDVVLEYVNEAIENQKQGKEYKPSRNKKVLIPVELQQAFTQDSEIEKTFKEFTPGKQYEFTYYISQAKRAETRFKRVDKIVPLILEGIGLNDKYRK